MTRTLRIQEQFGHAKVFEALANPNGGDAYEAAIATFDNRADADLFVAIATAEPKYQVQLRTSEGGWADTGHVPTTVRALADSALNQAVEEDQRFHPMRVRRVGIVRTISVATTEALTVEYEAWLKAEGLADLNGDALEILKYGDLPEGQRVWLEAFIARWQVAQATEDAMNKEEA